MPPLFPHGRAMMQSQSITFLQWALPRLGLTWTGFRRVRRQVSRRVAHRLATLHLPDAAAYRAYLETHADEWAVLDTFCRIPISRFLRDKDVFDRLATDVLPGLAVEALSRGAPELRCWSAGCASGEEPYSLSMLWRFELARRFPDLTLTIVATDVDEQLLARARVAKYRRSSLREVPKSWIAAAFLQNDEWLVLQPAFRSGVEFRQEDVRERVPHGPFDVILCRNLVCTYFDAALQRATLARMIAELRPGGAFVIGRKEHLPDGFTDMVAWVPNVGIFRKGSGARATSARTDGLVMEGAVQAAHEPFDREPLSCA